jgi:hypothetical protein
MQLNVNKHKHIGEKVSSKVIEQRSVQFDDINLIPAVSSEDSDCLVEMREVLARHNKLDRFGILLLHSHFPVADDEILLEETDTTTRTSTVRPVKRAELDPDDVINTTWSLNDFTALQACTKKQHMAEYMNALQVCTKKEH